MKSGERGDLPGQIPITADRGADVAIGLIVPRLVDFETGCDGFFASPASPPSLQAEKHQGERSCWRYIYRHHPVRQNRRLLSIVRSSRQTMPAQGERGSRCVEKRRKVGTLDMWLNGSNARCAQILAVKASRKDAETCRSLSRLSHQMLES